MDLKNNVFSINDFSRDQLIEWQTQKNFTVTHMSSISKIDYRCMRDIISGKRKNIQLVTLQKLHDLTGLAVFDATSPTTETDISDKPNTKENKVTNAARQKSKKLNEAIKIDKLNVLNDLLNRPGLIDSIHGLIAILKSFEKEFGAIGKSLPDLENILRIIGYDMDTKSGNRFLLQNENFLPLSSEITNAEIEDTIQLILELKRRMDLFAQLANEHQRASIMKKIANAMNEFVLSFKLAKEQFPFAALKLFELQREEFQKMDGIIKKSDKER
jgi:hypothetical protein